MITYEGKVCSPPEGFIAIVVAKFNRTITQRLLDGALAKLRKHGVRDQDIQVCWVPGAFEIPVVAGRFATKDGCLAVICLGAVIKGETSHDEHINRAVSLELTRLSSNTDTPIIFGILTCNTVEQAEARSGLREQSRDKSLDPTAGNKGAEAAEAALEMIDLMTELPESEITVPGAEMFSNLLQSFGSGPFEEGPDYLGYGEPYLEEEEVDFVVKPKKPGKKKDKKK